MKSPSPKNASSPSQSNTELSSRSSDEFCSEWNYYGESSQDWQSWRGTEQQIPVRQPQMSHIQELVGQR